MITIILIAIHYDAPKYILYDGTLKCSMSKNVFMNVLNLFKTKQSYLRLTFAIFARQREK